MVQRNPYGRGYTRTHARTYTDDYVSLTASRLDKKLKTAKSIGPCQPARTAFLATRQGPILFGNAFSSLFTEYGSLYFAKSVDQE